ncbi:MAG: sulfite oxidase-like oxidoreductase [Chloroflexi bacterium]|nr:sulfite oxidase-like oxidoreductase [Chloroflexota bacterium]
MTDAESGLTAASRLPPGQVVTRKWPVLHYGTTPRIDLARWRLTISGSVENPESLDFTQVESLSGAVVRCDIHCVTRWSRLDNTFEGVPFTAIVARARPHPDARFVTVHAEFGFTANLRLDDLDRPDVLLATRHDGAILTADHGWPLRLVVPHLYFWKSVKWVRGIEFGDVERPGFWERNGYHMRGDPWREERYG